MQTSTDSHWSSFSQHVGELFPEQINNLKKLTRNHLEASNDEQKARFIKVVYVDHYDEALSPIPNDQKKTPRVVLWEAHPTVRGLDLRWNTNATTIDILKKSLRDSYLPANLSHLQAEFYFASTPLRGRRRQADLESLRLYLLFYCDKIYAKLLPQSINETWQKYKDYFKKAQDMVLANPTLYTALCRNLKKLFDSPDNNVLEDDVYRYLVLLRSLPESLAYADKGHIAAAESVRELLALLDILEGKVGNREPIYEEVIYNVINALEWLAYLVPKMYEVQLQGPPLYKDLVECLEKYITEKKYKLAIRLEAAWALGWASVSSIAIATCVHQSEKSPKSRIYKLNSNVLRQVVGIAYLRASFTLVSFGPARVTPGAEKMALPGGYLSEQALPNGSVVTSDYARQAASDVVYNELASIVEGNIQILSILTTLAAFWLFVNALITTLLLQDKHFAVKSGLLIPPSIVLLVTIIILSFRWGRGYWRRISVSWATFLALAISPWVGIVNEQHIFVIVGTFAAFVLASLGSISSWVTIVTGIPALFIMLKKVLFRQSTSAK